jgi:hypothetical protein
MGTLKQLIEKNLDLDYIKRNITILVHNPLYVIGVWFYEKGTGAFNYSSSKEGHSDDPKFNNINKSSEKLIRGRLIKYEDKIICVAYLDPEVSMVNRLSERLLVDLKYRCEYASKQKVNYILDDSGEILLESKKIDEINKELEKRLKGK